MTRRLLVVAALLLINLVGIAAAAENSEHTSKNAQKLIATLDSVGINNHEVQKFIAEADTHIDRGFLYLSQQETMGGKLALRYHVGGKPSLRQMELHYAPDDSHLQLSARTNSLMVGYHMEFR